MRTLLGCADRDRLDPARVPAAQGSCLANLRFFIWLSIIGLVIWGVYVLVTRPWRYS